MEMDLYDTNCAQLASVHDLFILPVAQLRVGHKIEIRTVDSTCGWQLDIVCPVLKDGAPCNLRSIGRELELSNTRRSQVILDPDQPASIPVQTVKSGKRAPLSRLEFA